jgi:hypothetical protein
MLARRKPLFIAAAAGAVFAVVGIVTVQAFTGGSSHPAEPSAAVLEVDAAPAAPPPPPEPVPEPWRAHRDLAVTYAARGQLDDAYGEVQRALRDDPAAAGADAALVTAAVATLDAPAGAERVATVVGGFRANPGLVPALLAATTSRSWDLRHNGLAGLAQLGLADRVDLVAVRILDVEQAPSCPAMRASFKELVRSKDPRVKALAESLRERGSRDPHVKCLGKALKLAARGR